MLKNMREKISWDYGSWIILYLLGNGDMLIREQINNQYLQDLMSYMHHNDKNPSTIWT